MVDLAEPFWVGSGWSLSENRWITSFIKSLRLPGEYSLFGLNELMPETKSKTPLKIGFVSWNSDSVWLSLSTIGKCACSCCQLRRYLVGSWWKIPATNTPSQAISIAAKSALITRFFCANHYKTSNFQDDRAPAESVQADNFQSALYSTFFSTPPLEWIILGCYWLDQCAAIYVLLIDCPTLSLAKASQRASIPATMRMGIFPDFCARGFVIPWLCNVADVNQFLSRSWKCCCICKG